jgi:hypothetical protein
MRPTCDVRGFLGDESPKCLNFNEKKKKERKKKGNHPMGHLGVVGYGNATSFSYILQNYCDFNINIEFVIDGF